MNVPPSIPGAVPPAAFRASPDKTLRTLFLTLFLRGRSSRGLQKQGAPKSVGKKLWGTLVFYALFGCFGFFVLHRAVFSVALYLHGMTLVFLGMFVAGSAGEVLFNRDEADILLHRPVSARSILWAKIRVLIEISLWLAFAFNLAGFFIGSSAPDGSWAFLPAHAVSTVLEALFCTSGIVLVYQLCLRWFGRERLDGLMTTAQVFISVAFVCAGQVIPRLLNKIDLHIHFSRETWWLGFLPPAWFAGLDDAIAGSASAGSCLLAGFGLTATAMVTWLAFGKLAHEYGSGLQTMNETVTRVRPRTAGRRWIDILVNLPVLRWWLRDPVARASFLLTAAYLVRDRDVKLRVYPGLAPVLVMPLIFLLQNRGASGNSFFIAFAGGYLGLVPLLALGLLRYSQQWQASDIFRAAPLAGPGPIIHGARRAVLCILTLPLLLVVLALGALLHNDPSQMLLFLPGLIALPIYSLIPGLRGKSIPLSLPTEEGKSAGRGVTMILVMFVSMALSGVATVARMFGWFHWLILIEAVIVLSLYFPLRASISSAPWPPME